MKTLALCLLMLLVKVNANAAIALAFGTGLGQYYAGFSRGCQDDPTDETTVCYESALSTGAAIQDAFDLSLYPNQ